MIVRRIQYLLSHHPKVYALIAGVGIVLFWRGVWHTADTVHFYLHEAESRTISLSPTPWWDGPLSFIVGSLILYFTGAFISSFIGNELILAGLRSEKKAAKATEDEIKSELESISAIKYELANIAAKLDEVEQSHSRHN